MAIEFVKGMNTCGKCSGEPSALTADQIEQINACVDYLRGHGDRLGDDVSIVVFACSALIAANLCEKFDPDENDFAPVEYPDHDRLLDVAERNRLQAARGARGSARRWDEGPPKSTDFRPN